MNVIPFLGTDDFLAVCLTLSNFLDLIGQHFVRALALFGIQVPSLSVGCRSLIDFVTGTT